MKLFFLLSTIILFSCNTDKLVGAYVGASISIEYLNSQGKTIFEKDSLLPQYPDVKVYYIRNNVAVDFYQLPETLEHSLKSFTFYKVNDHNYLNVFLDYIEGLEEVTTLVQLNGFSTDTISAKFSHVQTKLTDNISITKIMINGQDLGKPEYVTIQK
ncbi:MAG: hypothetical protein ABI844_06910 [Saprospiraceae bacterium]